MTKVEFDPGQIIDPLLTVLTENGTLIMLSSTHLIHTKILLIAGQQSPLVVDLHTLLPADENPPTPNGIAHFKIETAAEVLSGRFILLIIQGDRGILAALVESHGSEIVPAFKRWDGMTEGLV